VPLYLTEADVEALLTPADALAAVESSFRRLAEGSILNRARGRVQAESVTLQAMSAVDTELRLAGVKSYASTAKGTSFVVTLFDAERGDLVAVIEADRLGQLRTGAASGVAAKYLARSEARTLGVIGCGWQAEGQVRCIREAVPAIERTVVYCRTEKSLKTFCRKLKAEAAETHRDAAELDVVVTATWAKDPVLRGEWLQPGALVCAMGANNLQRRELDNQVLERATFVCCDSIEQSKLESGDLVEPIQQGVLDWLEVHELQEVVAGELQGRQSDEDVVLFKSNGIAAWDVAAAARVLELAREQGRGTEL
jgi:ornithine cyclodeaminase/alanine dehydrogenase